MFVAQSCPTLCDPMDCSLPGSSRNFPGKKTGLGSHALLQGIFLTQGSNPSLRHCRQILYHLSQQGSPQIRKLMLNLPKGTQLASDELGFSRQEHWSGLPFPPPMRESEVAQSCLTLSDPMDCSLPGSSIHGIFQARVLEWVAIAFSERIH